MSKAACIRLGLSCAAALCAVAAFLLVAAHYRPSGATERLALAPLPAGACMPRTKASAPSANLSGAININAADEDALCGLTGVGPALAERIIWEREQNGPFAYPEDLLCVNGIGQKTFQKLLGQFRLE